MEPIALRLSANNTKRKENGCQNLHIPSNQKREEEEEEIENQETSQPNNKLIKLSFSIFLISMSHKIFHLLLCSQLNSAETCDDFNTSQLLQNHPQLVVGIAFSILYNRPFPRSKHDAKDALR